MNVTIGCDPELFIFDNVKQRTVPAIGKIGGSKASPMNLRAGGMVQLDGTVLEFGTAPATSSGDFIRQLQVNITEIRTKLDNRFHGRYELRCGALAGYDAEDIEENHIGLDVGCSPQYKFTSHNSLQAVGGVSKLSREAIPVGGHIHVGFGCNLPVTDERLVVSAARFTELFHRHMPRWATRGSFGREEILGIDDEAVVRIKPYGLEYRNMPSYWLADKELCSLLQHLVSCTAQALRQPGSCTDMLHTLTNRIDRRMSIIESAAEAVPAKYQNTLPLDFLENTNEFATNSNAT